MAGLPCRINIPSTALAAGVAKTVVQIKAPANQRLKILGYAFFFDSATPGMQPVAVRQARATATFGTLSAATPQPKEEGIPETPQMTAGTNATVEPTFTQVLGTETIPPQQGYVFYYPAGTEETVKGGSSLNYEFTAPNGVNVRGWLEVEE